ncbi:MAG: hypothetical protein P8Z79_09855 [Sedimentisphaerales bacterium]
MAKRSFDTSMGGAEKRFPPTAWTQLLDASQKKIVLDKLCARYWKPLYCYLRSMGFGNEQAKDLVQGFLTERVIDRELIRQADKTKGKLRTFLLTAIRNYTINTVKGDKSLVELDKAMEYSGRSANCEVAFDRAWANELLQTVLEDLKLECQKRGKTAHWQLFHQWLLEPCSDHRKPRMKDTCQKYDIANAAHAYHMIENIKRRFRTILREHLRSLVDSDDDVDAEISSFISIFQ